MSHSSIKVDDNIDNIDYFVIYSSEDKSILGWLVNENDNRQSKYSAHYVNQKNVELLKLYKNYLLCYYEKNDEYCLIDLSIDLNNVKYLFRLRNLEHENIFSIKKNSIGFLSNGSSGPIHLVVVSLNEEAKKAKNHKIYLYSFEDKPETANGIWKCFQQYDIENVNEDDFVHCFVYQTKLFLFNGFQLMTQYDLLKMMTCTKCTCENQYFLFDDKLRNYYADKDKRSVNIVINKSQTLIALNICGKVNIFSMKNEENAMENGMENGMWISKYVENKKDYIPMEFVTLKDDSEGLIIYNIDDKDKKYILLDPFQTSDDDAIDITQYINNGNGINNININNNQNFDIKFNKKLEKNNWITDKLKDQTILNKELNKTYHSNIYTLPIFNDIKDMLKNEIKEDNLEGKLLKFVIENNSKDYIIKGSKKSQNDESNENDENDGRKTVLKYSCNDVISYKQLNNQDLALITKSEILIYTIYENEDLGLRYCRCNKGIKDIEECSSLPPPDFSHLFKNIVKYQKYKNVECEKYERYFLSIINNPVEFSRFYLEMLSKIIDEKIDESFIEFAVKSIFDKVIKLIEDDSENPNYMFPFINLNLFDLSNHFYSNLIMKYISCKSLILDPTCLSIINSTSPYKAYSREVYIKKSSFITSLVKDIIKPIKQEKTPAIRLIIPFSEFCDDKDKKSFWNKFLNEDRSFLFSNIDTDNFYRWWNFAAIIDFKWRNFGKKYYLIIWVFYAMFFLFFALASTLKYDYSNNALDNEDIFFIISIILGLIHLIFEIRQCLPDPRNYFYDPWNYLDIGAYSLPIITSIYWIIIKYGDILYRIDLATTTNYETTKGLRAISNLLLNDNAIPSIPSSIFDPSDYKPNNIDSPWNKTTVYHVFLNGTIYQNVTFIEDPNSKKNLFDGFIRSLLSVYLLLIGNPEAFSADTYYDSTLVTILLVLFTFLIIYLMNLFIGLLNLAINEYNKYEEFFLLKAMIIREIELYYLPACLKKKWNPYWIYYDIPVKDIRELIHAIDNKKTYFIYHPIYISKRLRNLLDIPEPKDLNEEVKVLQQQIIELKKQNQKLKDLKE
ncbi:uncharacterized protein OCT59_019325 [Rhizophagus irregularis]|uniref:uncharacterized protein n=1 Tax=Rhizophagus irregularis TaxID=588596 RepID=UPI003329993B|nr:hypothetical protein OCT59_019325 [Rhizophagus irregularis]